MGLLNEARDFGQAASNAVASNVSAPVDGIAWLLRKLGVNVGTPVGGSDWMAAQGLTRDVKPGAAQVLGETAGLLSPTVAAAKAPQIARGLLTMGENAAAPGTVNVGRLGKQRGAVNVDEYGMSHRPMKDDAGASRLHDLEPAFGRDIYGPNARQYFGGGLPQEAEVLRIMNSVRGNPDAWVTIYRGGPKAEMTSINPGDWVALDRRTASEYGDVISKKVKASDLTSWADSLLEFGYYPKAAK